MKTLRNEHGSRMLIIDDTMRHVDLVHAHGTGLLFLGLARSGQREARLSTTGAAQLSRTLDHFARHQELPDWDMPGSLGAGVWCGAGI